MTIRRFFQIGLLLLLMGACAPRLQPLGQDDISPALDVAAGKWQASDGRVLPLRHWLPKEPAKAILLSLHGFNDYGNSFASAGKWLAGRGIATYAPDQRGFGASPYRGLWPGENRLALDVLELTQLLRRHNPQIPFYWLGDSMGGAVVLAALQRSETKPDGIILVAPAVWGRGSMPVHYRIALWLASYTVPWMTVTGRGLNIQASDNIEMLRQLSRDPLVIKETRIDAIHGLVNLMDTAAETRPSGLPVLLLYGAKDEVIPKAPVETFAASLKASSGINLRVVVYRNGWHMLLRDLQAETVWRDIAAWIQDSRAELPSGAERQTLPLFAQDGAR
ncbi:alpha/beta hydrolase [uncultured Ferrovibrio sp.]|jgi:acylglycerol lipase|uniref:alpha/beta hydrolase n=1 Tax=uncultured Ferrovibrio sp. TaxID=1576913 RepID=UPI00262F1D3E|nr:alpha/beta hydrolase [uncultured Ferrovibrio sp.]